MKQVARIGLAVLVAAGMGLEVRAADQDAAAAQAEQGGKLYAKHCASCHGDAGQGTKKAPPVVGKDALPKDPRPTQKLRKAQFRTAKDVADFVVANMPGDKPGSLKAEEYFAILAFDLKANGVALTRPVDGAVAAGIVLHP